MVIPTFNRIGGSGSKFTIPRHHLDVSLSQTVQVGTDAHGTPRDVGQREGVLQGENP